ncbi:MAG: hypothetical protein ABDH32_01185 [Candidatus Caldarchaeales archaeon]
MTLTFENLAGIFIFFLTCLLAMRYVSDNRIKVAAFIFSIAGSAYLAGFLRSEYLYSALEELLRRADPIGVTLSTAVLSAGAVMPIGTLRRPLITAGATGLGLSLLGIPVWLARSILLLILVALAYLIYRALKPVIARLLGDGGGGGYH